MALEVIEGYEIDRTKLLGEGGFGAVFEARQIDPASDIKLAVKISDEEHSEELQSEANLLKKSFHHVALFQKDQQHYLFMERVPGKNLHDLKLLAGFPFSERIKFLWLLALDLNELHHHRISGDAQVHLDIKPGNIMVDVDEENKKVKDARFVDRGNAYKIGEDYRRIQVDSMSTPGYVSPELLENEGRGVGVKTDLPPFAVVMFEVLGVSKPFKGVTILPREIKPEEFVDVPEELKLSLTEFGKRMAATAYLARPNSDEALEFFTALNNYCQADEARKPEYLETLECIAIPQEFLNRKKLPELHENTWKLFLSLPPSEKWVELVRAIAENTNNYPGAKCVRFLRELDKHEDSIPAVKQLKKSALQNFVPKSPEDELALFLYFSEEWNYSENEQQWIQLAITILKNINVLDIYGSAQCSEFFQQLHKHKPEYAQSSLKEFLGFKLARFLQEGSEEKYPKFQREIAENIPNYPRYCRKYFFDAIAERGIDNHAFPHVLTKTLPIQLELFGSLSKKKHYQNNEQHWKTLATKISTQINDMKETDKLLFLRELNKHNKDTKMDPIKNIVTKSLKTELNTLRKSLRVLSAERRAVKKLIFATSSSCFFRHYRQRLLKEALNGKDKNTSAIVQKFAVRAA